MTIGFDLGHDLDLEFSRSNIEFAISQPKVVRLPRNEKQTYRLNSTPQMWPMGLTLTITLTFEFCRSNMTLTFDHTHDLDHGSSWSNFEIAVSQNGRADWHFTKGVAVGRSWPWPRSGVWIYQIVTGVTSVVGVPSTHLVIIIKSEVRSISGCLYKVTAMKQRYALYALLCSCVLFHCRLQAQFQDSVD